MDKVVNRRRKKKFISPNPLFEKWLVEWKQEAAEKGMKIQYTYAKALASLRKYPLPLSSGKEAKILEYFGDKICAMLDTKLLEWNQSTGSSSGSQSSIDSDRPVFNIANKPSTSVACKLIAKSPKIFKTSVNIKTVNLGRVNTLSKPNIMEVEDDGSCDMTSTDDDCFYLFSGCFHIVLCVDNCETFSGQGKNKQMFLSELQKSGVSFDVRKLHVGDFLWIAQESSGERRELVLDYIVERKRMDDFAKSIKDGRFREQKFRMKACGLRSPIYLVEKCRASNYLGLPEATLEQAIVNTQIIDGFLIKRTCSVKESATYLSIMTKMIESKFQNQTLMSASKESLKKKNYPSNTCMTFKEFNSTSIKNKSLSVREMFAKHLLQFHGLSVERAAAIVDKFETPAKFLHSYDTCLTEEEKEKMVASIKFGMHNKNIGPALSRSLYQFYCVKSSK